MIAIDFLQIINLEMPFKWQYYIIKSLFKEDKLVFIIHKVLTII